jgi:hypothetical protein
MLNVNNSISNNDKKNKSRFDIISVRLSIIYDSFCHDMINCAIVNCTPPPPTSGERLGYVVRFPSFLSYLRQTRWEILFLWIPDPGMWGIYVGMYTTR